MSLTDSVYRTVREIILAHEETSNISFDSLHNAIHDEITNKAITYSWNYDCILSYIKQHTDKIPTKSCVYLIISEIKRTFNIRNPVTTEDIFLLIKGFYEEGKLSFVEENKIKIKNSKISVTLGIPKFISFVELQTKLYDLAEREGLEIKMQKDFSNPIEYIIYFSISGKMEGLANMRSLLKRQIKLGSRVITKKEIAKEETDE